MKRQVPLLLILLSLFALQVEAQEREQLGDSLAVLQQKVQDLELQLQQLTDVVVRLEARVVIQEQRAASGLQSGNHSHRPVEISNLDNEVVRVVRSRCSLSQFGGTVTFNCR